MNTRNRTVAKQVGRVPTPSLLNSQSVRPDLALLDAAHEDRPLAEAFVKHVFEQAYQARLQSFSPVLIGVTWPDKSYAAVAGVRSAGNEKVFLEHYLDAPLGELLSTPRRKIAEISNLAPASAGQARWLIFTLNGFLTGAGFSHVVFTLVPRLYNAFRRMGLPLTQLAPADADALPAGQAAHWGSYYDSKPRVYSGDLREGEPAFRHLIDSDPELRYLSDLAFKKGAEYARTSGLTV